MTDILITRNRHRVLIIAQSDVGRKWILENVQLGTTDTMEVVSIDVEHMEEMLQKLRDEGLEVESP